MKTVTPDIRKFLETVHPYDSLPADELERVSNQFYLQRATAGRAIYSRGEPLAGLFLIMDGEVEIRDHSGVVISRLMPRNSFGERGLLADGLAVTNSYALADTLLLVLPVAQFRRLMAEQPVFRRFFSRGPAREAKRGDYALRKGEELMSRPPITCSPGQSVREAAELMRDRKVSSLCVVDGERVVGILTTRDLASRVLAQGRNPVATTVETVMTADPIVLPDDALGTDVLNRMLESGIAHLPVVRGEKLVGMVTQTDLTRFQAISAASMIRQIAEAEASADLVRIAARVPQLLVQLVGGNNAHDVVTRQITDITDAITRRLIVLAETKLGPPPVPYLWLACGSQGRQEQTGVTDQDNCIVIDDSFTEAQRSWFERLARFVTHGLDACGYVFCPGDMMASNPEWCQPSREWRRYFDSWIDNPVPKAQMLASVMFDLRPIYGQFSLFEEIRTNVLERASRNSIFVAHMIGNSLKHAPPLGLLRGFATIRNGEHRNQIDMKHNGVVPVVDLGRVYALKGRIPMVNTRARLEAAEDAGIISAGGARDLIAAYDLIADMRLRSQAEAVKAGRQPDNFLAPYDFGDFERSHLRDAFVVVRTMQSALVNSGNTPA
ncbi:DUF294 nucleotidyltransferase-like domain-containing protein [Rhizobium sp. NTR19]|uniref:DUF294 nucleotidyltransferase-like domain-containing protein n=1 Tax=Neorhizobium turbinariae TaxID=2937795 RepID=A0ABT0IPQ6_9HYPH|nr:DUF294 nucleotidyltransferase-like domain-containing protein [Neorhizobium turbinariae]MCK8779862.1 DUF294 nucleotidyltransferase-like domain-containing protein [Neorhizobium turbinariae]